MTNYETHKPWFDDHMLDFVIGEETFAVDNRTNKPTLCSAMVSCSHCQFNGVCNAGERMAWLRADASGVDWTKVAVDTKIQVMQKGDMGWRNRYFCKFEGNTVYAFADGATSFSSNASNVTPWDYARLYTEEEE